MALTDEIKWDEAYITNFRGKEQSNYGMASVGIIVNPSDAARMIDEGWDIRNRPTEDNQDRWILWVSLNYNWWNQNALPRVFTLNEEQQFKEVTEAHISSIRGVQYREPCHIVLIGEIKKDGSITAHIKELWMHVSSASGVYIESSKSSNDKCVAPMYDKNFRGMKINPKTGVPNKKMNNKNIRDFGIVIQDEELAQKLIDDGWNIWARTTSDKEGAPVEYITRVNLDYDGWSKPPVTLHRTDGSIISLGEEEVGILDSIPIDKVIVSLRAGKNKPGSKYTYKGYVQSLEVWMAHSYFEDRYAPAEECDSEE